MMPKISLLIITFFGISILYSCSKKTYPTTTNNNTTTVVPTVEKMDSTVIIKKADPLLATKTIVKPRPKTSIPKVMVVNDKYANKSVDGRYYYDLQGHRYWRSNKDGKYYLFNKSMLTDDAFKKPN